MLPTKKVLCESWVAESLDDAIVRALSTSHRAGQGARISCTKILCVAGVRDLVRKKWKDRFVGGQLPPDRGVTRGKPKTWAPPEDGASLTISRDGG